MGSVDGVDGSSLGDRGIEIPLDEFSAIVADFAQLRLAPDHPAYFVAVGQFAQSREEA